MLKRSIMNKVLLLFSIQVLERISDSAYLQRLVFEIQKANREKGEKTFNYEFVRWYNGPFSTELEEDLKFLIKKEYITPTSDNLLIVTKLGAETLREVIEAANIEAVESFNSIMTEFDNKRKFNFAIDQKNTLSDYKMGDVIEPVR